jgi:predicted Holliday junction resolvase-like endonuclease
VRTVISIFLLCIVGILGLIIYEKNQKIKNLNQKLLISEGKYNLLLKKLKEKKRQRETK